jgi:Tfp pilus assembly protein PilN
MDLVVYQVFAVLFCVGFIFLLSYYLGYRTTFKKSQIKSAHEREEMLTIERALKAFWDHEKEKLEIDKQTLEQRVKFLEEKLEQYRRKAAGVGMMGLRKNKLSDMLVTLLIENESLEEKLFLQNMKLKQERDEFLENEMRSISYKRILLSELLTQTEVRREMEKVINDRSRLKRLEMRQKELEPLPWNDGEEESTA